MEIREHYIQAMYFRQKFYRIIATVWLIGLVAGFALGQWAARYR